MMISAGIICHALCNIPRTSVNVQYRFAWQRHEELYKIDNTAGWDMQTRRKDIIRADRIIVTAKWHSLSNNILHCMDRRRMTRGKAIKATVN